MSKKQVQDKFRGALLGTYVGDALGSPVEGWTSQQINTRYGILNHIVDGDYTDDTEMMIGLAESLVEQRGTHPPDICHKFLENYTPTRGYGMGTRSVFAMWKRGVSWDQAAKQAFPGGSYGNGAAMRIAPVALLYHKSLDKLIKAVELSSITTHAHPLGIEGALIQAYSIALAYKSRPSDFSPASFLRKLIEISKSDTANRRLKLIQHLLERQQNTKEVTATLGCGSEAFTSVPTAIYSFLAHWQNFEDAVVYAVNLGGDTDTIGAMTGAISGALYGLSGIPKDWIDALKKDTRTYVIELADKLCLLANN